jgi:hypothetical protein
MNSEAAWLISGDPGHSASRHWPAAKLYTKLRQEFDMTINQYSYAPSLRVQHWADEAYLLTQLKGMNVNPEARLRMLNAAYLKERMPGMAPEVAAVAQMTVDNLMA